MCNSERLRCLAASHCYLRRCYMVIDQRSIRFCINHHTKFSLILRKLSFERSKRIRKPRCYLTTNCLWLSTTTKNPRSASLPTHRVSDLLHLPLVVYIFLRRHIYVIVAQGHELTFHSIDRLKWIYA